jgi:hypothetical protein
MAVPLYIRKATENTPNIGYQTTPCVKGKGKGHPTTGQEGPEGQ